MWLGSFFLFIVTVSAIFCHAFARIAQLVEHSTDTRKVLGSTPSARTRKFLEQWARGGIGIRVRFRSVWALLMRVQISPCPRMKKSEYQNYFAGKKITVMGLGLLGRGLGDAKFLAEMEADLIVTDLKTEEQLKTSVAKLKKFPNIKFVLGEHRQKDFQSRDYILKNPDVKPDSPFISEARKNNVEIKMSTSWFAKIAMDHGVKIIGITGTRGKSTVTQLIYEILIHSQGQSSKTRDPRTVLGNIYLGGNVRGVSTLPLLKKLRKGDLVVMELDSWQLQGFGDEKISPNISVFTTFYPDHLNYYKGDMKAYFADKAKIYTNQKVGDTLIIGEQLRKSGFHLEVGLPSVWVSEKELPKKWKLKMPGEHNRYNAALAVAATRALKIPEKNIRKVVENFKGVSGRLELMRTWKGRKIYNDTTSTTPEATLVALEALGGKKNIILICGGADKTLDMTKLLKVIPKYCKEVIWLPGTGTDKIFSSMPSNTYNLKPSIKEAVSEAVNLSKKGDTILLSPAFASFGLFKNEFDRGDQFNRLVKKLR